METIGLSPQRGSGGISAPRVSALNRDCYKDDFNRMISSGISELPKLPEIDRPAE